MDAPTYILAMSSQHDGPELAQTAIDAAASDGAELLVMMVAEPVAQMGLSEQLLEQSFLGVGQMREATEELKRTQLKRATERLSDIEVRAQASGVVCQIDIVNGDFEPQVLAMAKTLRAKRIYLFGQTQSKLRRLLFESDIDKLVEGARCEVVLIDSAA